MDDPVYSLTFIQYFWYYYFVATEVYKAPTNTKGQTSNE